MFMIFKETKCALDKVLAYGSESWPLKRKDEKMLQISERRILWHICSR
jgi:hypothetical protein